MAAGQEPNVRYVRLACGRDDGEFWILGLSLPREAISHRRGTDVPQRINDMPLKRLTTLPRSRVLGSKFVHLI